MLHAKAWSDCKYCEVEFNAVKWAENASDEDLIALAQCDCGGDYAADAVAIFMADHDEHAKILFDFLQVVPTQPVTGDTNGFECQVNVHDFGCWIKANKPHLVEQICK